MKITTQTERALAASRATRWIAAGLLIILFAIPSQAFAQCSGATAISVDGADNNGNLVPDYYYQDLPDSIEGTLNPRAGGVLDISVDQVRFALSCFDNGDQVPCANGNDGQDGNNALTPVQFTQVGAPGGTCGATLNSNVNGVVTFDLPEATLDGVGCTIIFDTELQDRGIDTFPNLVTPAVAFNGTCQFGDQTIDGSAAGFALI